MTNPRLVAGSASSGTGKSPSNRRLTKGIVQALPLGAISGLVLFMVSRDGGFAGTIWYPVALVTLALAVTVAFAAGHLLRGAGRVTYAAIASLAAFSAWSFASIGWAAVRGDAWTGSNRGLLYLLVFALLAAWPVSTRAVWPVVLAAGLIAAVEGLISALQAVQATDPSQFMIGSRLSAPLGYPNATAALYMTMAWLMIGLASRPWLPAPARGLALGLAGFHVTLNLLSESRGSIFTLPLVAIAYFVLVPGRLRSLWTLAALAVGLVPLIRPVLDLWGAGQAQVIPDLRRVVEIGALAAVGLALSGWLFAAIDDRRKLSPRVTRAAGIAVIAALVVGASAAVVVVQPWDRIDSAWHSFKYHGEPSGTASRFGGLGSNRYDFWRVGLIEFDHHPLQGIGADNFLVPYLQLRHSSEEPLYPHSLAIRLLAQTGIVGTALFAAFLALTLVAVNRIGRGRRRDLACVLVVAASVWLFHGLVDWLWEVPALGVLGMALLGTACGLVPRAKRKKSAPVPKVPLLVTVGEGVAALAVAATLVLPWLAERDDQRAAALWHSDPAAAFRTLDRANELDPLSDGADVLAGAIASRLHRYDVMRDRFQDAVSRSPEDWYANLELGIAASLTGHHALAALSIGRAVRLDPGDPIARSVQRRFASGRPIDSDKVDREFATAH